MQRYILSLILVLMLLPLAACAAGPPMATPTAIPLAATATAAPRPTRPAATPTAAQPQASDVPPTETPPTTPTGAGPSLTSLDDQLAEQTAEAFVDRLATGDLESAFDLYLTDQAKEVQRSLPAPAMEGGEPRLVAASMLEFRRATSSSYEARARLVWGTADGTQQSTQTMTLRLVYQRGLWLIDDILLANPQAVLPTPTRPPRASAARRSPPLQGTLVFQVSSGGDIYVIDAAGTGLRRVTDGLDPAWSPDGDQIAFTRWRSPWGLYLLDATGEERIVDGSKLKEPAWSPDGTRLAFTTNRGSDEPMTICFFGFCFTIPPFSFGQIWTADLEAGGELLSLPLDDQVVHAPAWSPNGLRIVYAGQRGLTWIDRPDEPGGEWQRGRFDGGSVWDTSPSYSPDGQQIVFMGRVHNRWEIFVMNADGSGRARLTRSDPKLDPAPSNVAPAWSPSGDQIAFLSNRDGHWRIYVMNADGSQQRSMFGDSLDGLGIRYEWATERVLSWKR
ncbi:MAG: hypothetical protein PVJ23_05945 [Anaerolineae bacterium]|jgi:dipeptidyl aminopeptidase/acylaminoacyl peptidase